jgi:hypothetical protein
VVFCASSAGDDELTIKFAGLEVEFVIAETTDSDDNPPVVFCASSAGDDELTIKFAGLEVEFVIAETTDSDDNPPVVLLMLVLSD